MLKVKQIALTTHEKWTRWRAKTRYYRITPGGGGHVISSLHFSKDEGPPGSGRCPTTSRAASAASGDWPPRPVLCHALVTNVMHYAIPTVRIPHTLKAIDAVGKAVCQLLVACNRTALIAVKRSSFRHTWRSVQPVFFSSADCRRREIDASMHKRRAMDFESFNLSLSNFAYNIHSRSSRGRWADLPPSFSSSRVPPLSISHTLSAGVRISRVNPCAGIGCKMWRFAVAGLRLPRNHSVNITIHIPVLLCDDIEKLRSLTWTSNGKWVMSIGQELRRIAGGIHKTLPSYVTTAIASRCSTKRESALQ